MDPRFLSDLSGAETGKTPLTLGKWGKFVVEKSRRNAPQPILTRYSFDPRISNERYEQLKSAFDTIDTDRSGFISLPEILKFLSQFSDELDEEYITTIFENIDQNHDNQLSIQEFIEGYLEQVNGLTEALSLLKNEQAEKRKVKDKLIVELEENSLKERENSYGIMEGSQLVVKVVEAQNLNIGTGKPNSYVELKCEQQRIKTSVSPANRNPNWEESFTFNIKIGGGEMLCSIFSQSSATEDEFVGSCTVPLKDLEDQIKHERWYSVTSKVTQGARLFMSLQWIHHKSDYLRKQIEEWEETINSDSAEISRLESELKKLGTSPFGMFVKDSWVNVWERRFIAAVDEFTENHMSSFTQWEAARQVFLAIFTVVCLFACFYRPDFLDLSISLFAVAQEFGGWKPVTLRLTIAGVIVAFLADMFWLFVNSRLLTSESDFLDSDLKRFSYVLSLFNYIVKLPLLTTLVKAYVKDQHHSQVSNDRSRPQIPINISEVA